MNYTDVSLTEETKDWKKKMDYIIIIIIIRQICGQTSSPDKFA